MSKASAYMEKTPLKLHPNKVIAHARILLTTLGRMRLALHRVYWCFENREAFKKLLCVTLKLESNVQCIHTKL
jgi:hypothetical protein